MSVLIETSIGEIVVDLFVDKCYRSSMNFIKLCKLKYYNFHLISYIEKDFIAQITSGLDKPQQSVWCITQGNEYNYFKPEIKFEHKKKGYIGFMTTQAGDLHVACSQFYFTLTDNHLDYLDGQQAIFGEVAEGMDILEQINTAICDEDKRPFRDIRIKHTVVLDDPFVDPPNFVEPDRSPLPTEEMLQTVRLDIDESLEQEDEGQRRKAEMDARALTLEMIGDLPFAEIKPPENVLFVCKLNPVTRDEDLEVIFGRFGPLVSCEIIRDKATGESLCYAFVEYENREDAERAYEKMVHLTNENNVLIDDKRIHVDFSQSVSKLHTSVEKGPMEGLVKRRKYRDEHVEEEYDLVFEHGSDSHHVEKRKDLQGSKRRVDSRSRERYRDRSRDRDRNSRYVKRSRSRDRGSGSYSRGRYKRSISRDRGGRSRDSYKRDRSRDRYRESHYQKRH